MNSLRIKKMIVTIVLALLTAWPVAHHVIVRVNNFSPWKGFGFSMYCVPPRLISLSITSADDGRPLHTPHGLSQQGYKRLVEAMYSFNKKRAEFGPWVVPHEVASTALQVHPGVRRIEIKVEQAAVNRKTAMMEVERDADIYKYPRSSGW